MNLVRLRWSLVLSPSIPYLPRHFIVAFKPLPMLVTGFSTLLFQGKSSNFGAEDPCHQVRQSSQYNCTYPIRSKLASTAIATALSTYARYTQSNGDGNVVVDPTAALQTRPIKQGVLKNHVIIRKTLPLLANPFSIAQTLRNLSSCRSSKPVIKESGVK